MAVKIGITGPVGSIKAEALGKIIEMLKNQGKDIQGVLVSEIMEHGKLNGYSILDIYTKRRIVFADTGISSRVKIDKIGVDTRLLEELLIPAMQRAIDIKYGVAFELSLFHYFRNQNTLYILTLIFKHFYDLSQCISFY